MFPPVTLAAVLLLPWIEAVRAGGSPMYHVPVQKQRSNNHVVVSVILF